jgi:hypothetical protein
MKTKDQIFKSLVGQIDERYTKIEITETCYSLKPGRKTVFQVDSTDTREISRKEYAQILCEVPVFRKTGSRERVTKSYTHSGYLPVRLVSTSPYGNLKIVREFNFVNLATF